MEAHEVSRKTMTLPAADFDWVSARAVCTVRNAFEDLRLQARANQDQRNEQLPKAPAGEPKLGFGYSEQPQAHAFAIYSRQGRARRAVDFSLSEDEQAILIQPTEGPELRVTLTLSNDGICKFKINDEPTELDAWQVLKRALEGLFFPA